MATKTSNSKKRKTPRRLSGYNLFVKHAFKNGDVTNLKEAGVFWRHCTQEKREYWNNKAKTLCFNKCDTRPVIKIIDLNCDSDGEEYGECLSTQDAVKLSLLCDESCPICLEKGCNLKLQCSHCYHTDCLKAWAQKQGDIRYGDIQCCVCRCNVSVSDLEKIGVSNRLIRPTNMTRISTVNYATNFTSRHGLQGLRLWQPITPSSVRRQIMSMRLRASSFQRQRLIVTVDAYLTHHSLYGNWFNGALILPRFRIV